MTLSDEDRQALAGGLADAEFPELPNFQRGKVMGSYDLPDGARVLSGRDWRWGYPLDKVAYTWRAARRGLGNGSWERHLF